VEVVLLIDSTIGNDYRCSLVFLEDFCISIIYSYRKMYLAWSRDFSFSQIEKICHIKIQVVSTIYVAAIVIPYLN
jgi:hypothetical protein